MGVATVGVQEALHFRCYITARKTRNMIHGWSKRSPGCSQDDDGHVKYKTAWRTSLYQKTKSLCAHGVGVVAAA